MQGNGDGENDVLYLKTKNISSSCIQSLSFEIYDRWGNTVFKCTDLANGWDGKRGSAGFISPSGKPYETDVFVYRLKATFTNNTSVNKKGNIIIAAVLIQIIEPGIEYFTIFINPGFGRRHRFP